MLPMKHGIASLEYEWVVAYVILPMKHGIASLEYERVVAYAILPMKHGIRNGDSVDH